MADRDLRFGVLYVDDQESSRKAFRLACGEEFPVLTASNHREGLKLLGRHNDEIAILVVARCMENRKGDQLLQCVRACHPQVVRLLASDGCSPWAEQEALENGSAEGIIPIPWDPPELTKRLGTEFERFAAQQNDGSVAAKEAPNA
jgi:two-component system, probable response regulator PhcQ